jgi:hypothetical protein
MTSPAAPETMTPAAEKQTDSINQSRNIMKVVQKFNNAISANICKGVLEENGVPAFVLGENLVWSTGAVNTDLVSIEVVVDDSLYEKAVGILNSMPDEESI